MKEKTPANLVNLINELAFIDIGLFKPAAFCKCNVSKIPSDIKAMLKLPDKAQAKFIWELNKGNPDIKHGVKNFDLTKLLKYYDEEYSELKTSLEFIKTYFSDKQVDVVLGKGEDNEEGDFCFDWILVLDNKILFSFIFNLED